MATDYEKIYQDQPHALGEPTKEIIDFFEQLNTPSRVLDAGCGQGRDALAIARLGHHVTGVDLSASGIQQLQEDARKEKLDVQGEIANLLTYEPTNVFDVILFDRTLHMLPPSDQLTVLARFSKHVANNGYMLINDLKKNLPAFENEFLSGHHVWHTKKKMKGFLFVQKKHP